MCGEKELFFALYSKEAPDACPLILYKKSLKNSKIRKSKNKAKQCLRKISALLFLFHFAKYLARNKVIWISK